MLKNNEWMEIHDEYQIAPNLNISMGCMLAQLMICYKEVKTYIKFGAAFCETSMCLLVSVIIVLRLDCLRNI